jgi:hypothetical protein
MPFTSRVPNSTLMVIVFSNNYRAEGLFVCLGNLFSAIMRYTWLSFGMIDFKASVLPLSPMKPWRASRTSFTRLSRTRNVFARFVGYATLASVMSSTVTAKVEERVR